MSTDAPEVGAPSGSPTSPARRAGMLLAFAPWLVFALLSGPRTLERGALAGLAVSVLLSQGDIRRRRLKVLDATGLLFFAAVAVAAPFLPGATRAELSRYSFALSTALIAGVAVVSLAFVPFTEQYARESTPREVWDLPLFRTINRHLTLLWGVAFALVAVVSGVGAHLDGLAAVAADWVAPLVLLGLAGRVTAWYPDRAVAAATGS